MLPEHVAADPDLKQRFEREAKTISSLNHPHTCTLYDIGCQKPIAPSGTSTLSGPQTPSTGSGKQAYRLPGLEYLEGDTLALRLQKGALPLDQALTVAIETADALDKAHRQGSTQRELTPGHIMLTTAGRPAV